MKIFICYAHKDRTLLKKLEEHLAILKNQGHISLWYDCNISPGAEWKAEIAKHMNDAELILLLISSSFMASEFCYSIEMKTALDRSLQGKSRTVPVILRHLDLENAPFSHLQYLPPNGIPIASRRWATRDEAFAEITKGIRMIIEEMNKGNSLQDHLSPDRNENWTPVERKHQNEHIPSHGKKTDHETGFFHFSKSPSVRATLIYRGHKQEVYQVAWSPNGQYIASAGSDKTIHVWGAFTGKNEYIYRGHASFSPKNWWYLFRHSLVQSWAKGVSAIAWSPDSLHIASASADSTVRVWEALTGKNIIICRHRYGVYNVRWSPNGSYLATVSGPWKVVDDFYTTVVDLEAHLMVWEANTGQKKSVCEDVHSSCESLAWSPDSKYIISQGESELSCIWEATTGHKLFTTYATIKAVAWSPNGKYIAAITSYELNVWKMDTSEKVIANKRYQDDYSSALNEVIWSPDNRYLAIACENGTLIFQSVSKSEECFLVESHTHSVRSISWSPDGSYIASGGEDRTVRIWNVRSLIDAESAEDSG